MSSQYDGLMLPQLLDLLHPPVEPAPVAWLPQTLGWQIVGAWLLVVSALLGIQGYRWWKRNRYRREALAQLREISKQQDPERTAGEIALLIKRTALAAYPRAEVASLYGEQWAEFLIASSKDDHRVQRAAQALASAAYRTDTQPSSLIEPARRWIKVHRA